jgi:bifunctional NMN adenylyltransferase/nudix hydrolase
MATTGVIIGRFQVPELTLGHKALIVKAYEHFDQVGFLLGCCPADKNNPLPFSARFHMLEEWDPVFVWAITDVPGYDDIWSTAVDQTVAGLCNDHEIDPADVVLVGGRQSFIPHYSGGFPTLQIPVWVGRSGTQVREAVAQDIIDSDNFRKGIIWAVHNYGI